MPATFAMAGRDQHPEQCDQQSYVPVDDEGIAATARPASGSSTSTPVMLSMRSESD
jgi:hypothetical protein